MPKSINFIKYLLMKNIEHQTLTADFFEAWKLAIQTVISIAEPLARKEKVSFKLLRDHLNQPFIEHFSFVFGNQIFFCCIVTDESTGVGLTSPESLKDYAKECGAIPCLFPLVRTDDGSWKPHTPDIPLHYIDETGDFEPLLLASAISNDLIGMSDWEISDWAINIVVEHVLEEFNIEDKQEVNYQSTTGIYPQIWFKDKNGIIYYIVVCAVRFPETEALKPNNIAQICSISNERGRGFFASVSFAQADGFKSQPALGYRPPAEFIYRGCSTRVRFDGLENL
mgnify:CR=1 FL=1